MKCATPKLWPQYLLTVLCNIGTLIYGVHVGWLAPLIRLFMSEDSPLHGGTKLTMEEISWIGSLMGLSLLLSTLLFGFLLQRIGRKLSSLMSALPNVLSFLLLMFPYNVHVIYLARFIAGFAGAGAFLVTPVYVNESASDNIRGFLCGLSAFFFNMGMVISSTLGGYLPYCLFNALCLAISLSVLTFYWWLPETPIFLISRGKTKEVGETLRKLRRKTNKAEIDLEVARLQSQLNQSRTITKNLRSTFSDQTFWYATLLSVGLVTLIQLCGSSYIITYSPQVFHDTGSSLPPAMAATMNSCMLLLGSIVGALLMDRIGRKPLLLTSLAAMAAIITSLIAFSYLRNKIDEDDFLWVPSATLLMYMGTFSAGLGSVSYAVATELFPPEIRGVSGAVCGTWACISGFLTLKYVPFIVERLSIKPVLVVFGVGCALGWLFVYFLLIETKGITPNVVAELIRRKLGKCPENDLEMASGEGEGTVAVSATGPCPVPVNESLRGQSS